MKTRNYLLTRLKAKRNQWISGEAIGESLSISRTAVWKAIGKLREQGYDIRSSPRKGYCLVTSPDHLVPSEILSGLQTTVLGKGEIIYLPKMESTNARARELAAQGAPEGTLVVADSQTLGRGRLGRTWFSPQGTGIYASLILRPPLPPDKGPRITFVTAVAAAEAFVSTAPLNIRIKWPNDILIHDRKVAGILTEMGSDPDRIHYMVVGIGINVHQKTFPKELKKTATSLFMETKKRTSRVALLQTFLDRMEHWYGVLKREGFEPVLQRWKELADMEGRMIRVRMPDKEMAGQVEGIDSEGVLLLKDEAGQIQRILSGDVLFAQEKE